MPEQVTIERIERAARKLAERRPAYAAMLTFYADVFAAQEKSKSGIELEPIQIAPDKIASRQKEGLPLVNIAAIRIDATAGRRLMEAICRLIAAHGTNIKDAADRILRAIDRNEIDPQRLFQGLLAGDDADLHGTAERVGVAPKALTFIAYNGMQPSVEQCAVQLATHLDAEAVRRRSGCPVCGSAPGLTLLAHEGHRVLCCSFCRHQWRSPRVFCALCSNTRSDQLHYFFAEGETDLRADLCDHCRRYTKTVDTRDLARPVFPPLEQVASLHLDMIAAEKGYASGIELDLEG